MQPRTNDIYATPDMLSDVRATVRVKGFDVNVGAAAQMITANARTAKAQPSKAALMKFYSHADKAAATEQKLTPHAQHVMRLRRDKPMWNRERLRRLGLKHAARVFDNSRNPQPVMRRRPRRDPGLYKVLNANSTFDVPLPQNFESTPRPGRVPQQGRYLVLRTVGKVARVIGKALDAEPVGALLTIADNLLGGRPAPQPRRRQQPAYSFG